MSQRVKVTLDDPFGMCGKNPRRVATAVRQNIRMQRGRIIASWVFGVACLAVLCLPLFGVNALVWLWLPVLVVTPVYFLSVYCDRKQLRFEQSRLAECERLIREEPARP